MPSSEISLTIDGLNMDKVYESFVAQIADEKLKVNEELDIKQSIEKSLLIEKIKKKIMELENKKRNEKQFNIQVKYSIKIKQLKKQLTELI